jgi:hypothetical protein
MMIYILRIILLIYIVVAYGTVIGRFTFKVLVDEEKIGIGMFIIFILAPIIWIYVFIEFYRREFIIRKYTYMMLDGMIEQDADKVQECLETLISLGAVVKIEDEVES